VVPLNQHLKATQQTETETDPGAPAPNAEAAQATIEAATTSDSDGQEEDAELGEGSSSSSGVLHQAAADGGVTENRGQWMSRIALKRTTKEANRKVRSCGECWSCGGGGRWHLPGGVV
jgi:hypothetical protein